MNEKIFYCIFIGFLIFITVFAFWRTPITEYEPINDTEQAITALFVKYINARNNRDVDQFLSTLDKECQYMVAKDVIVSKEALKGMLPALWMQNDDDTMVFGSCMTWECVNENFYRTGMLINPKFTIFDDYADVRFQFSSGVFLGENFFRVNKKNNTWLISSFLRPMHQHMEDAAIIAKKPTELLDISYAIRRSVVDTIYNKDRYYFMISKFLTIL